ncbi:hypothetical protein HELRODRAFT_171808 [Helobdella robusta]|uniref:SRCR domain-containing protein n=1 Tax=Helobdella robusta TaxID=6412 RepID=T1F4P9_HELRO|nr:hypothetical protein HELRODRAFT_171808 [Helobdella robusta]ESO05409.1 hypothetical protein HELRODRAFT_171808 [Helobdella robusta]
MAVWVGGWLFLDGCLDLIGGEYCDTEVFRAECGEGWLIVMLQAQYGRKKLGRCLELELGHINCSADVLHVMDRRGFVGSSTEAFPFFLQSFITDKPSVVP